MNLRVRPEQPKDIEAIDNLLIRAFGGTEESTLVRALRASDYFVPPLSLVAEDAEEEEGENRIVGYILFSRINIETGNGAVPALALAPMAVLPERQRQGIGTQLILTCLEICRQLGHRIVVLVGHPEYYPRFGFEPARAYDLDLPFAAPDEAFMALELVPGALKSVRRGKVRFSPPFEMVV